MTIRPRYFSVTLSFILTRLPVGLWLYRWHLLTLLAGVVAPLYGLGVLAEEVAEQENFRFDRPVLLFLHGHATPLLDQVMPIVTLLGSRGSMLAVDVLVLLVLLGRRRWASALFWGLAASGAGLIELGMKHVFGRIRPSLWPSVTPETTFSFPSGHAVGSAAFVVALAVLAWRTRWRWPVVLAGSLFVAAVGLSRLYLGVHYPSDVLASWMLALAWVLGLGLVFHGRMTRSDAGYLPGQGSPQR